MVMLLVGNFVYDLQEHYFSTLLAYHGLDEVSNQPECQGNLLGGWREEKPSLAGWEEKICFILCAV